MERKHSDPFAQWLDFYSTSDSRGRGTVAGGSPASVSPVPWGSPGPGGGRHGVRSSVVSALAVPNLCGHLLCPCRTRPVRATAPDTELVAVGPHDMGRGQARAVSTCPVTWASWDFFRRRKTICLCSIRCLTDSMTPVAVGGRGCPVRFRTRSYTSAQPTGVIFGNSDLP